MVILRSLHIPLPEEIREWLELKSRANQRQSDKEDPRSTFEMLNLDLATLLSLWISLHFSSNPSVPLIRKRDIW